MGCLPSKTASSSSEDLGVFKVLLLGAGESGKSTIVKQLKSIYNIQLTPQDLDNYKLTLHHNCVTSMQTFADAAIKFGFAWSNDEEKQAYDLLKTYDMEQNLRLFKPDAGKAIALLWKSEAVQKAYARRNEYWNLDCAEYYFNNSERFAEEGWVPNEEDMIMARVRTTGIISTEFKEGKVSFNVLDVAGQRSERKKWQNAFEGVRSVVFVVSLAGYNQVMFEDGSTNRMLEQLTLFESIANNALFEHCPIYLIFNKKDLFESMLKETPLSTCFPDYKGDSTEAALNFVKEQFLSKVDSKLREKVQIYEIAARFRKDVQYTWQELAKSLAVQWKKLNPTTTSTTK